MCLLNEEGVGLSEEIQSMVNVSLNKNDLGNELVWNGGQHGCFKWWMGFEWKFDWYMLEHVLSLRLALLDDTYVIEH